MRQGDRCSLLADTPVTVVVAHRAAPDQRKKAYPPGDALAVVSRLSREAEFGDRRDLIDLYEMLLGESVTRAYQLPTACFANRVLAAVTDGRLLIIPGWTWAEAAWPSQSVAAPPTPEAPPSPPRPRSKEVVLRTIELERRYHDDAPVQGAPFKVKLSDGSVREGTLDATGHAKVEDVPDGSASVQFGPDTRSWDLVDRQKNPAFREHLSISEIDAIIARNMELG